MASQRDTGREGRTWLMRELSTHINPGSMPWNHKTQILAAEQLRAEHIWYIVHSYQFIPLCFPPADILFVFAFYNIKPIGKGTFYFFFIYGFLSLLSQGGFYMYMW